jgi:hypothetical protein
MHYILYETKNIINGKIYVGCHKSESIDDSYLGSGTLLSKAIQKHGKENFIRKTISEHTNSDEMYSAEKEIVDADFVSRKDTYNVRIGGKGGWDHVVGRIGTILKNSDTFQTSRKSKDFRVKCSRAKSKKVVLYDIEMNMLDTFSSCVVLAAHLGVTRANISNAAREKRIIGKMMKTKYYVRYENEIPENQLSTLEP